MKQLVYSQQLPNMYFNRDLSFEFQNRISNFLFDISIEYPTDISHLPFKNEPLIFPLKSDLPPVLHVLATEPLSIQLLIPKPTGTLNAYPISPSISINRL